MRKTVTALGIAAGATWSIGASAQTQGQQQGWGTPALPPPPSATERQLDAGDSAGSFRRLELVYVNAEVGGGYMNIGSKFFQEHADLDGRAAGRCSALGAGFRFLTWTLGARAGESRPSRRTRSSRRTWRRVFTCPSAPGTLT